METKGEKEMKNDKSVGDGPKKRPKSLISCNRRHQFKSSLNKMI